MTDGSRFLCYYYWVCVPGIYSDYLQQTKNSNFDDLCTRKVVAMATSNRKDSQHFAFFHLLEATS